jgi:hypothetical protein
VLLRLVALAVLVLGAGCGSASVGETCLAATPAGTLPVSSSAPGEACAAFATEVAARVGDYLHWRPVALSGWNVEVVPAGSISGNHGGMTYFAQRLVQVEEQSSGLRVFIHELEHVRLGPDSEDHCGWEDFAAWELQDTGLDEASYDVTSCDEASGEK